MLTPTLMSVAREAGWYFAIATCIKLLLIPTYHSTDFEVHRHWLAITHSLPLSLWYSDETSQWTLDYPPLFAFFERFLSLFAAIVDPIIVDINLGLNYSLPSVIYFQRVTVIIADLILFFGIIRITRNVFPSTRRALILLAVFWSPALLIVDHVHFQYNGFLLGILIISLSFLEDGNRDLLGGFFFAVLICFKHLFLVASPVYFVYLLRHYCWFGTGSFGGFLKRLFIMGTVVLAVFLVAFGPFLYHGQMQEVLHRLFPFGRGLCHAYWAPNFWVFYIIADKALSFVLRKLGFSIQTPAASFTGGLVGGSPFSVLPQVTPLITFCTVMLAILPCLVKAWKSPQPKHIIRWVAYAYTCGFMFGWHVHEKASLHFVIPFAIIAMSHLEDASHYFLLSTVSCYSLFPLLYEGREYPVKVMLLLTHVAILWSGLSQHFSTISTCEGGKDKKRSSVSWQGTGLFTWPIKIYLSGLLVIETWGQFVHPYILGDKMPFLPLMLLSIYCAIGMLYSWIFQLGRIIRCS
ncbi:unnamed protein product [Victoria cruziana]